MPIDANRVKDIFLEAADMPEGTARAAFLEQSCGGDTELQGRVEALLRSHDPDGSFLGTPAGIVPGPEAPATEAFSSLSDPDPNQTRGNDASPPGDDEELSFLAPPARPDSLGRLGHYEILEVLGQGGFGIVFRAFDDTLQRVVAIKVMAPQLASTSPARKRFLREARSSAQVRHENVVQVYEIAEQPLPYLTMEFIPGETLQQRLDRTGPLEVAEVLRIGRQIAEGLAAAHATDLIHRDIKPGNILLEGGQLKAKITDFGLARAADDASISQSGIIAGTPMYMAPEQAKGEKLDQRADLFSLGSVLYQMVAGRPPFRANSTVAVLKRVADDTPRDIREIIPETPQWLCDIVAKLHEKDPDERFQSAREVADVLADCAAQLRDNSKLKDYSRIPRGKARRSGRRKWVAAAAVLLLPLLALAATEFAGVTHLLSKGRHNAVADPKAGPEAPFAAGRFALAFDGVKSRAKFPGLVIKEDHPLTVEAWAVLEDLVPPNKHCDLVANTGSSGFSLGIPPQGHGGDGKKWAFVAFSETTQRYAQAWEKQPVPRKQPVHLAGVYDSKGVIRLYVNGQLQSRTVIRKMKPAPWSVVLGGNEDANNRMHGRISELRISRVARYDDDFTPDNRFAADEDTLALYHFDEGEGNVLNDSSGNGHHGVIHDAKWVMADGSPISPSPVGNKGPILKSTLFGHSGNVYSTAFSPDGRLLASGGEGEVRLWDVPTGKLVHAIPLSEKMNCYALRFSPDGKYLLSAPQSDNEASAITLWEVSTGKAVGTLEGHTKGLYELSFAPDGTTLISAGWDGFVRLWDFPSRKLLREMPTPDGMWVRSAVFSKTGMIALGMGKVCLYDAEGKLLRTIAREAGPVGFSPDGKRLAGTTWQEGRVTVWDVETGDEIASWRAHASAVNGVVFSRDENVIVTAGDDGKVRIWDVSTRKELARLTHDGGAYGMAFSPNGNTLATTGYDSLVKLWNVSGILAKRKGLPPPSARIAKPPVSPRKTLAGFPERVLNATYSADGRLLAAAGDGTVRVYDAQSGELRYALKVPPKSAYFAVAFSPDGRHLLTAPERGADDCPIGIWDAHTGEPAGTLVGHEKGLFELSFSPDGKTLLSCGWDPVVRLWDFPSRKLLREIPTPENLPQRSAVFSRNGTIAFGGNSRSVHLVDREGKPLRTFDKDAAPLCFSSDGKRLAGTTWRKGVVTVWDCETGKEIASWRAHQGTANGVAFSRDGTFLVTAGGDAKVRFWDVSTRRELAVLSHDQEAYWVAFSPDGKTLATTGYDQVIKLWDVPAILAERSKSKAMPPIAPFTDADVARIAALGPGTQVEEVRKELMRRNPGFDGKLKPVIHGDKVVVLEFHTDYVTDISPVRALKELQALWATGSSFRKGSLVDLSPLRGMRVTSLNVDYNRVRDLTPLKEMPLTKLYLIDSPIADLTPLKGMPLEYLNLWSWTGSDLTPLAGMPLRTLNVGDGRKSGRKLDLSPLAGMPLESLCVNGTDVTDLTPLRGMPLKELLCARTGVSDLSPIRALPLAHLLITRTSVSDLSPLKGMPLVWLECDGAAVTDLSPIKDLPLTKIRCDFQPERDAENLRSIKTLETINGKPAAEFWKDVEKK